MASRFSSDVIVVTGHDVADRRVAAYLGVVWGSAWASPGADGLLNRERLAAARHEAFQNLVKNAEQLGADAVLGFRFDAVATGPSGVEVFAYGTVVKLARPAGYRE